MKEESFLDKVKNQSPITRDKIYVEVSGSNIKKFFKWIKKLFS